MRYRAQLLATSILSLTLNTAFAQVLDIDNPPEPSNLSNANKSLYTGSYSCSFEGNVNGAAVGATNDIAMHGLVKLKSDGNGKFTKARFANTLNQPGGGSTTCIYNLNTADSSYVAYKSGRVLEKLVWEFDPALSTDQTSSPNSCLANGYIDYILGQPTSLGYQSTGGKVTQVVVTSEFVHLNDDSGQLVPFIGGGRCTRLSRDVE